MHGPITFTLNGAPVVLPADTSPTLSVLDWLRGPAGLHGTKEGCAEGDCGACTVVLEEPDGARVPLNACLALLGHVHGRAVRTVEGLRGADGAPHPVQVNLAELDGTQCGFCTPGIVMTAWAHLREGGDVHDALAGNLCRCTGYRPIVEAIAATADDGAAAPAVPDGATTLRTPAQVFHRPRDLPAAFAAMAAHPGAWLLSGGTDMGLRVSEGREVPPAVVCLLDVAELTVVETSAAGLGFGAAVPYRRLLAACAADPDFAPLAGLLRRLGSRQIRGMGTLGGNLGTASPIGDALPPLVALGATLRLSGPHGERGMAVEDFLVGYRRNALREGEVIRDVFLPRPAAGALFAAEKLSKRTDQDIATVGLSAVILRDGARVTSARVALGGVGPRVERCVPAEAALTGRDWSRGTVEDAAAALERAIAPLSDLRGSAAYRRRAAGNLLRRLWHRDAMAEAA